jgi:hypothetical protein
MEGAVSTDAANQPVTNAEVSQYPVEVDLSNERREADVEDADLEAMKKRVAEMEAEAAKLREMNEVAERDFNVGVTHPTEDEKMEVDARSVYVGNVRVFCYAY